MTCSVAIVAVVARRTPFSRGARDDRSTSIPMGASARRGTDPRAT